ncbi:MAG TPA: phytanoyl-CoA dioxygenase family protein [Acidimicrobiales bacterium]|nr:phytanoyl-CoA dioxygenase family protein [Acidimicrobiales bacterium]
MTATPSSVPPLNEPPAPLHPWNRDFTWTPRRGPFRRLTDADGVRFDTDGYAVLRGALPAGLVDEARAVIDELVAADEAELAGRGGRAGISEVGAITFAAHLVTRSEVLRSFVRDEVLCEVAADLLGPDVNLYWDQAVYKRPEKPRRFPWHQDNGYTFVEPQHYLTCWIPLVPATPDNGCPQVAVGAHRFGTLAHHYVDPLGWECFTEPPSPPAVVPVDPGDVLVFSSLTPHLTGPNVSDEVRKAYIVQYAPAGAEVLRGDPAEGAGHRPDPV